MIIVFDLDDTLYPELEYVKSGFSSVAYYLAEIFKLDEKLLYNNMLEKLEVDGRGKIFDNILKLYNIYSMKNVNKCLSIYRNHKPKIELSIKSINCLKKFNKFPLYLVTDGNKLVQRKKINALQLNKYFKKIFITHCYGLKNAKPSTYCFNQIIKIEKILANQLVYIADNPRKDFINLNKEGFRTIQVKTGNYKNDYYTYKHEAQKKITDLSELKIKILNELLHGK